MTSRGDDDQVTALAIAAGHGDTQALEDFIRATQRDVWRFTAHLADVASADDLTQETFLRAINALPRFSGRSSARTWLLSIARRTAVDQIRYKQARPASPTAQTSNMPPTVAGPLAVSKISSRSTFCWHTSTPIDAKPCCSLNCWVCRTPKQPPSVNAPWAPSALASPAPGKNFSAPPNATTSPAERTRWLIGWTEASSKAVNKW